MLNPNLTPAQRHEMACEQADYTWKQLYEGTQPVMLTALPMQQQIAGMVTPTMLQQALQMVLMQMLSAGSQQPAALLTPHVGAPGSTGLVYGLCEHGKPTYPGVCSDCAQGTGETGGAGE